MPGEPRYIAVYKDLASKIRSGELTPGTQLPSYVDLAKEYGVSDVVVRYALAELKRAGLVRAVPRQGVFVSENVIPSSYAADMTQPGDLEARVRRLEDLHQMQHGERGAQSYAIGLVHERVNAVASELTEFREEFNTFREEVTGKLGAIDGRFDTLEALIREALARPKE